MMMKFFQPLWFLMGWLFLSGSLGSTALAAPTAQLRAQVKQLQTAYRKQSWQNVSTQATALLADPSLKTAPTLHAKVYLWLGGMLFAQKLKSLAYASFTKALRIDPAIKLPAGSDPKMSSMFAKAKASVKEEHVFFGRKVGTTSPTPQQKGGGWHVGWLIGLPVAIVGLSGLALGGGAGLNAQANAEQANSLLRSARDNSFPDPMITPTINSIHDSAKTFGTVANISYIVGGTLAAGGIALIVWAILSPAKQSSRTSALSQRPGHPLVRLPKTTTPLQVFLHAR